MSIGRDSIGIGLLGDSLYAIGGYHDGQYLKTVEKYDADKNEWTIMAPLNFSRAAACVVAVPNVLTPTTVSTV